MVSGNLYIWGGIRHSTDILETTYIANNKKYSRNRNSIPGELDTHTDARSAKKDVISTKPQKAMGAVRYSPEKDKEKHKPNLLPRFPPPNVAVLGACYPV